MPLVDATGVEQFDENQVQRAIKNKGFAATFTSTRQLKKTGAQVTSASSLVQTAENKVLAEISQTIDPLEDVGEKLETRDWHKNNIHKKLLIKKTGMPEKIARDLLKQRGDHVNILVV